ncbi:Uncharacterized protein TPAR_04380 [Tolypocladium paradoxum]|uniref:Sexual differentiation process protein isp4 n=1 Tax=Tolypocladium paradoxum TaxID=94208 RepID=A0A2S4KZ26_9HYPO|nr:Uncharacterized protein TPAR_04380 [Tolypocladium paradoxum]
MGLKERLGVRSREAPTQEGAEATGAEILPTVSQNHNPDTELRRFRKQHKWDPFLDIDKLDNIDEALASGNAEKEAAIDESLIQEDSPYYEVRSSVPPVDIDVPVNTVRAWVIGGLLCTIIAACNILLNLRRTPISITSTVVQLVPYPWGFQLLLMLSTQAMGFGVAGIARRFLIWPSSMVWPATLITCTVMYSLHDHGRSDPSQTNGWKIGRYSFFLIVALATFVWEWFPLVIAPFLSYFMWATWIAPSNVIVNQLFGGNTGLGLIPISFDWSSVTAFLNSPLQTPAFAILNVAAGLLLTTLGAIGLAYGGPEFYKYLPLSANSNFDRYAQAYNTSRILTADFTVNETAYKEYSPILLGTTFSLSYGLSFATLISTVTHVSLFYGADVWHRAWNSKYEEPDVHLKLMRRYKEAPEWWFAAVFAMSFAFGMVACQVWETHLPWWAYIVCILIGVVFFVPIGMIQAITN